MIIITGDPHAEWGILNKLMTRKRPDELWVAGDFGWWPGMEVTTKTHYGFKEQWILKGLKVPPCTKGVWWCDGNHEDHDDLSSMQFEGKPVLVYDKVTFMPRGTTLTLPDGRVVLFMGGADSIDKKQRTSGFDWFPDEIINHREFERAMSHERVDIVISHTCPEEMVPFTDYFGKQGDPCCKALSNLLHHYNPALWYFGHWHRYKEGKYKDTYYTALDCAGNHHGGKWWVELKGV